MHVSDGGDRPSTDNARSSRPGAVDGASDAPTQDVVLDALETVVRGLMENSARIDVALERAEQIRLQRRLGWTYIQIVEDSTGPLMVELLSTNIQVLHKLGHELRSAEARALRQEGLSAIRIAELFGVSRQRVAALLRPDTDQTADAGTLDNTAEACKAWY
jgi:hypothetical protein